MQRPEKKRNEQNVSDFTTLFKPYLTEKICAAPMQDPHTNLARRSAIMNAGSCRYYHTASPNGYLIRLCFMLPFSSSSVFEDFMNFENQCFTEEQNLLNKAHN
jgi:hypothetical protein